MARLASQSLLPGISPRFGCLELVLRTTRVLSPFLSLSCIIDFAATAAHSSRRVRPPFLSPLLCPIAHRPPPVSLPLILLQSSLPQFRIKLLPLNFCRAGRPTL
jgi:hypothetical protein